MVNIMPSKIESIRRTATVFPKSRKVLSILGENIKLARKRRGFTQTLISDRTGLSRLTVRKIERGDPSVSMGHYVLVFGVLGLVEDLEKVASDDDLGRKLQDIKLMS